MGVGDKIKGSNLFDCANADRFGIDHVGHHFAVNRVVNALDVKLIAGKSLDQFDHIAY